MSAPVAGGIFGCGPDEYTDLRQLAADIACRSFEARIGDARLPERFDQALWTTLTASGLTGLASGDEPDAGPAEIAVVLRGVARYAGAVPIAETELLARWLAGQTAVRTPDGPLTVAIAEPGSCSVRSATVAGWADAVPWARSAAAVILAVAQPGELLVAATMTDELTIVDGHCASGEPRDRVEFALPADRFTALGGDALDELTCRGAWARCVQIVGALDAAVELSVAHCRDREQFGRPLSAFQSVQHALATMAGEVERMRAIAGLAVSAAHDLGFDSPETDFAVSAAKTVAGQVVPVVSAIAHQLHGAIGTTLEHPLWLATTRAQCWSDEFGAPARHAARLGRLIGAQDPWDLIVGADPNL